jgi:hypothetical protein
MLGVCVTGVPVGGLPRPNPTERGHDSAAHGTPRLTHFKQLPVLEVAITPRCRAVASPPWMSARCADLGEGVSLRAHVHRNDRATVTLTLDWDRAKLHPIDDRTQRIDVPFPEDELEEDARISLASALVGLEVVGGPIEDAKLSHAHVRMEITRDADMEAIKGRLQALVDGVLPPAGEIS